MKTSKRISIIFTAAALAAVTGCASTPKQESFGEYVDDSLITTKVKAAIFDDSVLKSSEIKVETYKGIVQLSGFVSSHNMMDEAVKDARTVHGVVSVKNDMQVK